MQEKNRNCSVLQLANVVVPSLSVVSVPIALFDLDQKTVTKFNKTHVKKKHPAKQRLQCIPVDQSSTFRFWTSSYFITLSCSRLTACFIESFALWNWQPAALCSTLHPQLLTNTLVGLLLGFRGILITNQTLQIVRHQHFCCHIWATKVSRRAAALFCWMWGSL